MTDEVHPPEASFELLRRFRSLREEISLAVSNRGSIPLSEAASMAQRVGLPLEDVLAKLSPDCWIDWDSAVLRCR